MEEARAPEIPTAGSSAILLDAISNLFDSDSIHRQGGVLPFQEEPQRREVGSLRLHNDLGRRSAFRTIEFDANRGFVRPKMSRWPQQELHAVLAFEQ